MLNLLKILCEADAPSGNESALHNTVINEIKDYCEYFTDASGNIIAHKKGEKVPAKKIMVDAHLDEIGIIISGVTADGFLKFSTIGGISPEVLFCKRVKIGDIIGVIGAKPIHLTHGDEGKKCPKTDAMYIDIGAKSKEEALSTVSLGDTGVIMSEFELCGDFIKSKALDDRVGCAVLIKLIQNYSEYDFYATFTAGEEIGCRGAKTAAFTVAPDYALVLECTTAADIEGSNDTNCVCKLGYGPAISFMDKSTLYNREFYLAAINSGVKCQTKTAVTGGNNSGAIHQSGSGVKTLAISVPCRYIHSANSVANSEDIKNAYELAATMLSKIGAGEI